MTDPWDDLVIAFGELRNLATSLGVVLAPPRGNVPPQRNASRERFHLERDREGFAPNRRDSSSGTRNERVAQERDRNRCESTDTLNVHFIRFGSAATAQATEAPVEQVRGDENQSTDGRQPGSDR